MNFKEIVIHHSKEYERYGQHTKPMQGLSYCFKKCIKSYVDGVLSEQESKCSGKRL
jgi:hypothetical protein